ncbi:glycan-binding surface protein [Bacteroides gallinaceum]|uniref:glycan-binding surface protein n=1 Tax=Bacteroides gallinaceum TaxID=1462571 RepID=UPI0025AB3F36|nr:glycan-binding surface protein [Bacteroides gallinaceum]MDN0066195.1 glycan-binding surface protein [Bacteroides gallinaceum]
MKSQNKIPFSLFCLIALVASFSMASCEDEPDKYEVADGLPTVRYIRSPYAVSADSLITEASTGTTICLVGENLRSIYELYFNDVQAILNSSYMTDNTVIVDVPQSIPTEVSNKMYMVTRNGETVEYDFSVTVPAPTLTTMSCEYAPAGSEVTITGNYFVDDPNVPLSVVFPGDIEVTEFTNISQSSISFIMPECTEEGAIDVTTIYGTTTSAFHYLDTRGMLFDFDGMTGLGNHGWHDRTITSDETSITGNFVQLGDGNTTLDAAGGWNDSQFAFEYWPGNWNTPTDYPEGEGIRLYDLADFSDYTNMSIKFEMYIPSSNPWSSGAMQVIFAGTDLVTYGNGGTDIYGNAIAGPNNTYFQNDELPRALYRPWTTTGSYHTDDQWVTVSLPISSNFIYGFNGGTATGTLSADDFASLVIFVTGGGVEGTECTPLIKIDNIRAVPNR